MAVSQPICKRRNSAILQIEAMRLGLLPLLTIKRGHAFDFAAIGDKPVVFRSGK